MKFRFLNMRWGPFFLKIEGQNIEKQIFKQINKKNEMIVAFIYWAHFYFQGIVIVIFHITLINGLKSYYIYLKEYSWHCSSDIYWSFMIAKKKYQILFLLRATEMNADFPEFHWSLLSMWVPGCSWLRSAYSWFG